MIDYVKTILTSQFEAALCMMNQCIAACKEEQWEGRIASDTFRQVAYHTLFFVDLYLASNEEAFVLRELHGRGGDERGPTLSLGLSKSETLSYLAICRAKMIETMAQETRESLERPCGFSWRKFSRGELHIYNIRHVQHHGGQMSAYLRRMDQAMKDPKALPWIGAGWK